MKTGPLEGVSGTLDVVSATPGFLEGALVEGGFWDCVSGSLDEVLAGAGSLVGVLVKAVLLRRTLVETGPLEGVSGP